MTLLRSRLCLTREALHRKDMLGEAEAYINFFFPSALVGGEWSASRLCRFTQGKKPRTHWMRCWVDPRTGLDNMEK
jgi:hypothetical protein